MTERNRPRTSVKWQGFIFVPLTARARDATKVIHIGHTFSTGVNKIVIATSSESIFKNGEPRDPEIFAEAIFKLGVVDQKRYDELKTIIKAQEEKNWRSRQIRDLKNAIEETDIESSSAQDKAIKEFYPDWGFKP